MKKFILSLLATFSLVACGTLSWNQIASPVDCNQQQSVVRPGQTCTAIDANKLKGHATAQIWGRSSKFWPQNSTLRVAFIGGNSDQKNQAWKRFQAIQSLTNLTFVKVTNGNSDIRVNFNPNIGHWSYIGTDCSTISQDEQTMNLALTSFDDDVEWNRVALHEILHSIGFMHELQSPNVTIHWNVQAVLDYYHRTQGWSDEEIHAQVLDHYNGTDFVGTKFDPNSIMCYPVEAGLTTDGLTIGWNTQLTQCDVDFVKSIYPPKK